jgi:iron complex outermembrane receptor protein
MNRSVYKMALLSVSASGLAIPTCSFAQTAAPADDGTPTRSPDDQRSAAPDGEILVTARKRDETSIAVPVVLTAVSGDQLESRGIVRLDDIAKLVPTLQVGGNGASVTGGVIVIRGISTGENNPFSDNAVSLNIDGVQVSRAQVRRMAQMDIGQVEVLKGPQALFFGKNSPGGVISIRSADPTDTFQAKIQGGYEFYAREFRGESFISGPLTETLGARLAVLGTTMNGWFRNTTTSVPLSPIAAKYAAFTDEHNPKTKEFATRFTLKWDPTSDFSARIKASYDKLKDNGPIATGELAYCPVGGKDQFGGPDDCRLNGRGTHLGIGTYVNTLNPLFPADGEPFNTQEQALLSAELNYDMTSDITLTSVSGYYYLRQAFAENYNSPLDPSRALVSANRFGNNEFTQELRLQTDYDFWANVTIGAFYQNAKMFTEQGTFTGLEPTPTGPGGALVNPLQINNYRLRHRGTSYSGFGQISLKPTEQLEFTAGARWSYEKKSLPYIATQTAPTGPGPFPRVVLAPIPGVPREGEWRDLSPEFTISYRPSQRLTLFGSYKEGFLSGGFNASATNFAVSQRYDQQVIKGFEGGIKAALLDNTLRVNLAAYRYQITGLQISLTQTTSTSTFAQVLNAGKVKIQGLEGDFTYRTPIEGLSIRGGAGYNDAKYEVFTAGCYSGQSQAEGCSTGVPTTAVIGGQSYTTFNQQSLAGQQLLRAPKFSGNLGASFETDVGSDYRLALAGDMSFSSSYETIVTNNPNARQSAYQLFDASVRFGPRDERWELALVGQNLTNEFYALRINDQIATGTGTGRAANDPRGRVLADQLGFVNRGRQIMLRATVRFGER